MAASKTMKLATLGVLVTLAIACSASPVPMDAAVLDALSVDGVLEGPSADASIDRPRADGLGDGLPPDAGADARPKQDAFVPFSLTVTVNQIPAAMNGSVPFTDLAGRSKPFRLTVPRHGFRLDILFAGSEAKTSTLKVSASKDLGSGSSLVAAGTDLVGAGFTMTKGRASLRVPAALALPLGAVTFTASMSDGSQTLSGALTVNAAEKTFALDPFRLKDSWLIVMDQDNYTIGLKTLPAGTFTVESSPLPNGVADFDEDLRLVGLGSSAMLPAASQTKSRGVIGTNAIVKAWIKEEIVKALRVAYLLKADGSQGPASVNIAFFNQGDPGVPLLSSFAPQILMGGETHKNFSAISIGGGDPRRPFLGLSKTIDLRNIRNEANIGPTYGVFTTRAVSVVFALLNKDPQMKALAQTFFGEFVAALGTGGKAVGESPLDATILAEGFDPHKASSAAQARHRKLSFLVETLGRLVGALTAHEIGHALGLVANGAPPHGLFGGENNASFVKADRTTSGHIDTPGFNLMEAGPGSAPGATLNILQYLTPPHFNALNLAYLQGRILLLPKSP